MPVLVSSAKGASGAGYGAIVAFDLVGNALGTFCDDSRVADPQRIVRRSKRRPALCQQRYGENTIKVFDADGHLLVPRLVEDSQLSPLDLAVAPNGHIVVSCEWPFGGRDAISSVREYDSNSGRLVRIFRPDGSILFRNPRGLRFSPDGDLYCVARDEVVSFDFETGDLLRRDRQLFRPLRAGTRILRLIVGRGHHRYSSPTPRRSDALRTGAGRGPA